MQAEEARMLSRARAPAGPAPPQHGPSGAWHLPRGRILRKSSKRKRKTLKSNLHPGMHSSSVRESQRLARAQLRLARAGHCPPVTWALWGWGQRLLVPEIGPWGSTCDVGKTQPSLPPPMCSLDQPLSCSDPWVTVWPWELPDPKGHLAPWQLADQTPARVTEGKLRRIRP